MALRSARLAPLALGGLALVAGLWGGLLRIGWDWPPFQPDLAAAHGPLMVVAFLGTVIGLERAVALGQGWAFGAPLLAGLGGLALLAGLPASLSAGLFVVSSLLLAAVFAHLFRLRPEWSSALLALGVAAWLAGNALWLAGRPLVQVVPWWAGFLVFTIAGERLELAQVLLGARVRLGLLVAIGLVLAGLALSWATFAAGVQLTGLGLLALAGWLLRYDVARRALRRGGLPRFGAVCLLLGYVWLAVAGLLWLLGPVGLLGPFWYDAMLHTLFVGFVFSMIFGHAPTIVPAVTGIAVPFRGRFYVHVALLHASLLLRTTADLVTWPDGRRWGGLLNAVAIVVFAVSTILAARGARQSAAATASRSGRSAQTLPS